MGRFWYPVFDLSLEPSREGEAPFGDLKHILSLEIHWEDDSSAGMEAWPLQEICMGEEGPDIELKTQPLPHKDKG